MADRATAVTCNRAGLFRSTCVPDTGSQTELVRARSPFKLSTGSAQHSGLTLRRLPSRASRAGPPDPRPPGTTCLHRWPKQWKRSTLPRRVILDLAC